MFGADADVGFREQGYLLLAAPPPGRSWLRTSALQRSMRADIELLEGAGLAKRFPGGVGRTCRSARMAAPAKAGSTAQSRRPVPQGGAAGAASRSSTMT
jgi:hypothetical protein